MIIMELCENGALREKIQEELPWNLIVRLASDISSGLSFLHENHIVHRFSLPSDLRLTLVAVISRQQIFLLTKIGEQKFVIFHFHVM
jgi:serine/threonine protein kinase